MKRQRIRKKLEKERRQRDGASASDRSRAL
jgi:hypothetical protein